MRRGIFSVLAGIQRAGCGLWGAGGGALGAEWARGGCGPKAWEGYHRPVPGWVSGGQRGSAPPEHSQRAEMCRAGGW